MHCIHTHTSQPHIATAHEELAVELSHALVGHTTYVHADDIWVLQLRVEHHLLLDLVLQACVAHEQLVDHLDRHAPAFIIAAGTVVVIVCCLTASMRRSPSLCQVHVRRRAFAEELQQRVLLHSSNSQQPTHE